MASAVEQVFHCRDLLRQILEWNRPLIWMTYEEHDNRVSCEEKFRRTGYTDEYDYYWTYCIYMWNEKERQFSKLILSDTLKHFSWFEGRHRENRPDRYFNSITNNNLTLSYKNMLCAQMQRNRTETIDINGDYDDTIRKESYLLAIVQPTLDHLNEIFNGREIDIICQISYVETNVHCYADFIKSRYTNPNVEIKTSYTYYFANDVSNDKYNYKNGRNTLLHTKEQNLKQHATTVLNLSKHQAEHINEQLCKHFNQICKVTSSKMFNS